MFLIEDLKNGINLVDDYETFLNFLSRSDLIIIVIPGVGVGGFC